MVEDEPSHLTMSSVERDGPILPIDTKEFSGFWSKTFWMRFLQGTPLLEITETSVHSYLGVGNSNELLEIEYKPEVKSTSNITQLASLSQRMIIPDS